MQGNKDQIEILHRFNRYYKKSDDSVVNIDLLLPEAIDFQIQHFSDAVKVFQGSIPPNRYSHYYLALVWKGTGIKTVGLFEFEMKAHTLLWVSSGVIHSSHSVSPDIQGYILSVGKEFLLQNHSNKTFLENLKFLQVFHRPYLYLNEDEKEELKAIFECIMREHLANQKHKDEVIRLHMLELLIKTGRMVDARSQNTRQEETKPQRLTNQFKQLLENFFLREREVKFYADKLHVHPNHLNATVKKNTGKSCSTLIKDRMILEAKCLLKSSQLSVKEIADYLGFNEPSSFSKYFKKNTRFSPLDYKNRGNI